jgi:HTH-type transcriptional regulator/antitoxin HipB
MNTTSGTTRNPQLATGSSLNYINMEIYSLEEVKDNLIGTKGTSERDIYEFKLQASILLKRVRKERNITQEQLAKLTGMNKAQISKLENDISNVTIETLVRIFSALNAKVSLKIT